MPFPGKKASLLLFLGDLVAFAVALWLTLVLRYWSLPIADLFFSHLRAFWLIFIIWSGVFFIFDLYRQQTLVFTKALPAIILRAQILNSIIAIAFFYLSPYVNQLGFTPKTNLLIDLVISFLLVWYWRRYLSLWVYRARPVPIMFVCEGPEVEELKGEIGATPQSNLRVVTSRPALIVFNKYEVPSVEQVANFYNLLFVGVRFISVQDLYERIFERVPLSLINERWFLEHISHQPTRVYDFLKRLMDLFLAFILGLLSLVFYPLVYVAIKLEDNGPIFFTEQRIGRNNRLIRILKFRSMSTEVDLAERQVTRVGNWLRRSRIDELPQLWSVFQGEQSLIGPRPERPDYVDLYREQIPYYDARHLIAPGLSGWAQLYHENHPHFRPVLEATREKLSYDLYYIKNRSLWLDLKIGLKTIKALIARTGI